MERTPHTIRGLWALRLLFRIAGRFAPGVAASLGERLFTTPPRWAAPERELEVLRQGKRFTVQFRGVALQCWRWGNGIPILLVHGWGGRGGQLAPLVGPLVERGFQVVTFDGPAHGESAGARTSLPEFAHALATVWHAHPVPPAAVVAHSMGAAASVLALRDQMSPEALVLIAPPARPADYLVRFADTLAIPPRVVRILADRVEERYGIQWSDLDLAARVREYSHPMLLVHDTEDQDALWSHGRELADAWPASEMITTSGLGHRRILRDEDVVLKIAQWLETKLIPLQSS